MELLLILSAMLSAVTGVFSGVGEPEARVHQAEAAPAAQAAAAVAEEAVTAIAIVIPRNQPRSSEVLALPKFAIVAAVPLYSDRLIE
jgi:hypothetical protein